MPQTELGGGGNTHAHTHNTHAGAHARTERERERAHGDLISLRTSVRKKHQVKNSVVGSL